MAFVATHPAVTSVIIGPRTMEQLEGLLKGADLALDDAALDRIDEIVPPRHRPLGHRRRLAPPIPHQPRHPPPPTHSPLSPAPPPSRDQQASPPAPRPCAPLPHPQAAKTRIWCTKSGRLGSGRVGSGWVEWLGSGVAGWVGCRFGGWSRWLGLRCRRLSAVSCAGSPLRPQLARGGRKMKVFSQGVAHGSLFLAGRDGHWKIVSQEKE